MILWVDGAHPPGENMRRDVLLLEAAERGAEAVLRLSRFEPFGITLGSSQRPERELDLRRCEADGVPWAVRPTGGRAIFHAQEWTYALAAPIGDPRWGGSSVAAYRRASDLVAASLRRLGVPARLVAVTRPRDGAESQDERSAGARPAAPCFASAARHEIVAEGRKLVGSAQRRTRSALLQQGSVLLGDGHLRLADYVAVPEAGREAVRRRLRRLTRPAAPWLGAAPPLELWAGTLALEIPGARRVEGEEGARRLTVPKSGSYTPALTRVTHCRGERR